MNCFSSFVVNIFVVVIFGSDENTIRTRTSSIIYKEYKETSEGMGQQGQRLLTATYKVWRVKIFIAATMTNVPSLFRNLQKKTLAIRERDTLKTRSPLWSTVRLSVL